MPEHELEGGVVLYGPWTGEFGWELMTWQAWCRADSKGYEKAYACSFPDMAPLYEDFAVFVPHRHTKRRLDWRNVDDIEFDIPDDVTRQITPFKEYRVADQKFIRFGKKIWDDIRYEYVIHARGINKGGKNYPREKWNELVQILNNPSIVSVGSLEDMHIEGTADGRGMHLQSLMNVLNSAECVIGQSSGVMHLATLCMAPIVVWGDSKTYFGENLDQRYRETWNPLKSKTAFIFDDNWSPDPQVIATVVDNQGYGNSSPHLIGEKVQATLSEELSRNLFQATQVSKRFMVTLSWVDGDKIKHFWATEDFPKDEKVRSMEHLLGDVKGQKADDKPRQHVMEKSKIIKTPVEPGKVPLVKEGKLGWL